MFKQLDFTNAGGLYVYQETLDWLQTSYSQLLDGLGAAFGNYLILTGCSVVGGAASAGWVVINGEILPFLGGNVATYCYVESVVTNEQYDDGTQKPAYTIKRVKFTAIAGAGTFTFASLQPLPYQAATIQDCLNTIKTIVNGLVNIESAVILSGCAVSGVGGGNCTIAAGTVMFSGNPVSSPAYTGAYPAYLKPDATWVTAAPGSGDYVTFDPYTSQYYADVQFRNQHRTGDVVMQTNSATLASFDTGTGLGKWRWKGWKICDTLQSRVPLGYDRRTADPGDGIWDAAYNIPGNSVGEKKHQLSLAEFTHHHTVARGDSYNGNGQEGYLRTGGGQGTNPQSDVPTSTIGNGDGTITPHENRQPSVVVLYIEKI